MFGRPPFSYPPPKKSSICAHLDIWQCWGVKISFASLLDFVRAELSASSLVCPLSMRALTTQPICHHSLCNCHLNLLWYFLSHSTGAHYFQAFMVIMVEITHHIYSITLLVAIDCRGKKDDWRNLQNWSQNVMISPCWWAGGKGMNPSSSAVMSGQTSDELKTQIKFSPQFR